MAAAMPPQHSAPPIIQNSVPEAINPEVASGFAQVLHVLQGSQVLHCHHAAAELVAPLSSTTFWHKLLLECSLSFLPRLETATGTVIQISRKQ